MQQYFRFFKHTACDDYNFKNESPTSNVISLTNTLKVNVRNLKVFLKQEDIIEGFKHARIQFRKRGHFINLTEKSLDIKNYP
jgi:hypothetical protein